VVGGDRRRDFAHAPDELGAAARVVLLEAQRPPALRRRAELGAVLVAQRPLGGGRRQRGEGFLQGARIDRSSLVSAIRISSCGSGPRCNRRSIQ
jgi:hypothetical protein